MMVIIAVAAIMILLIQVVVPLFTGARVVAELEYRIEGLPTKVRVANVDEYRTIALALGADGRVVTWHPLTGTRLADHQHDLGETDVTAFARTINRTDIAFGFADGTVRFARLTLPPTVLTAETTPSGLGRLDDRDSSDGIAVFSRIPGNQIRRIDVAMQVDAPQPVAPAGTAITLKLTRNGTNLTVRVTSADRTSFLRALLALTPASTRRGRCGSCGQCGCCRSSRGLPWAGRKPSPRMRSCRCTDAAWNNWC